MSAQLLAHLGEIEARGLHRDLGYESMFEYAVRVLHMSDSEAGLRLHAARFARKFPASLEMLSRGELHLTAMKLLAPVLTSENAELLDLACLKTKQEIQLLIAKHCPQPDVPDAIRRLPTARLANADATRAGALTVLANGEDAAARLPDDRTSALRPDAVAVLADSENAAARLPDDRTAALRPDAFTVLADGESTAARRHDNETAALGSTPATDATRTAVQTVLSPSELSQPTTATPTCLARSEIDRGARTNARPRLASPAPHPSNRDPAIPISEGRYKIRFTAGQRVRDLLQEVQDLFRNQLPNGDIEVLFERALVLLVSERKKQLYAQTDKPRRSSNATSTSKPNRNPNSRHIPNTIKRRVYVRDKGQCRFLSPTGERCCARSRLEFHHIQAFGFGGPPTEKNIVLFCHAHNALMAERDYSREHIQRCVQTSRAARTRVSPTRPSTRATHQLTHAQPTHATAPEPPQLSKPQHKPTRSGIAEPRERNGGLNQPHARKTEAHRLDD
ncbi:MAG TPA: hypothetical protein VFG30_15250 [Polyangiales bacterium]|nr:hypothetical protein [Polyangiales bacterium]